MEGEDKDGAKDGWTVENKTNNCEWYKVKKNNVDIRLSDLSLITER